MTIQEAIELFDSEQYKEAFEGFAAVYNESSDPVERQDIMTMLKEAYYMPNEAELRGYYEKNVKILGEYPYFWDKKFADFSGLSFLLFPTSEESYYLYDKKTDRFVGEYDGTTSGQMRYFFQDLDRVLRVEDEDNLYNLTFLFDNVRCSEDVAMDNHIYLLYNSWEPLQRVMQVGDLAPILRDKKFVFLVERKQFKRCPINFKAKFGIDYEQMEPSLVRTDEVKRICYWYKHAYSGTMLSCGILEASRFTCVFGGNDSYIYTSIKGINLLSCLKNTDWLAQPQKRVSIAELRQLVEDPDTELKIPEASDYLKWLEQTYTDSKECTVLELFKGYFIYRSRENLMRCRITPMLVFDPHIWECNLYNELIHQFPYCTVLTCMRNPITVFGRGYEYGLIGWDKFQTQYILASDYCHAEFLSERLKEHYWGFRFEDLKTMPEVTIRGICRVLNIPFEKSMLEVDVPMTDRTGNTVHGFDQTPLKHDISRVLSDFDQIRLKIFYAPILQYYGYPQFPFNIHPMSEQLIREMLQVPFCFEAYNDKRFLNAPSKQELHNWMQEVLQGCLGKTAFFPKLIRVEGKPNE